MDEAEKPVFNQCEVTLVDLRLPAGSTCQTRAWCRAASWTQRRREPTSQRPAVQQPFWAGCLFFFAANILRCLDSAAVPSGGLHAAPTPC